MKKCCLLNNIKPPCPLNPPILGDLPEVKSILTFPPKVEGLGGRKTQVLKIDEV